MSLIASADLEASKIVNLSGGKSAAHALFLAFPPVSEARNL